MTDQTRKTAAERVAADLRRRIVAGEWAQGDRLPPIDVLEAQYPYSRMTVSKGMRELVAAGFLRSRGRTGTWVNRVPGEGVIGLLSNYDFTHPGQTRFAFELTRQVQRRLEANGRSTAVYQENALPWLQDGVPNPHLLEALERGELGGVVAITSNLSEWFRRHPARRFRVPMVDLSWHPAPHRVYIDFGAAAEEAVAMAAEAGRRRLGMIGYPHPAVLPRLRQAAADAGLELCSGLLDTTPLESISEACGYERLLTAWPTLATRPDALFVPDDVAAKGVCQAALRLGLEIGSEVELIVLANEGIDLFYPCPVRRLEVPLPAMASAAVELFEELMSDPHRPPREVLITPIPEEALQHA